MAEDSDGGLPATLSPFPVILSPSPVILSPSSVILSGAKDQVETSISLTT
jgi:hypothetical protein